MSEHPDRAALRALLAANERLLARLTAMPDKETLNALTAALDRARAALAVTPATASDETATIPEDGLGKRLQKRAIQRGGGDK